MSKTVKRARIVIHLDGSVEVDRLIDAFLREDSVEVNRLIDARRQRTEDCVWHTRSKSDPEVSVCGVGLSPGRAKRFPLPYCHRCLYPG